MLTPIFGITQDERYLYISIRAPNTNIRDTEIEFEDYDFSFYSKPYFLRLTLPAKITENGSECAAYDAESGIFSVKVSKANAGENFEGLDMITKLLKPNPRHESAAKPMIEVIGSEESNREDNNNEREDDETGDDKGVLVETSIGGGYDWHFQQTARSEADERRLWGEKYGFANEQTGVMARLGQECARYVEIGDPEQKSLPQRRLERSLAEQSKFSEEHYLSDLFDQRETIAKLIGFEAFWDRNDHVSDIFDDDDRFRLKGLPNKEYLFDKAMNKSLLLGVIDILFAYAYDMRVNEGEHNVESGWTICKLSATLSWFDWFSSLTEMLVSSFRRSLCHPLYRHWDLALRVKRDVTLITRLGREYVLKCFLDIHKLFNESGDSCYVLNDLYITDYCVWLQTVKPNVFASLSKALESTVMEKYYVGFELDILERAALMAIEQEAINSGHNILQNLENFTREANSRTAANETSETAIRGTADDERSTSENDSDTSYSSDEYTTPSAYSDEDDEDFPNTTTDEGSVDGYDSDDYSSDPEEIARRDATTASADKKTPDISDR